MSKIQADEISSIIKERIDNFELNVDLESIKSERKTMKIAIVGSDMMSRKYGIEAAIEQVIEMGNNYPIEIIRLENDHKISGAKPTMVIYDDYEYSIRNPKKMNDLVVEQELIQFDCWKEQKQPKENHPHGWYRKFDKKRFQQMIPDEFTTKVNEKAESLGLDYRLGDIIVSLKGNRGEILIATQFECSHIKGNFEKYNKEKHKLKDFS